MGKRKPLNLKPPSLFKLAQPRKHIHTCHHFFPSCAQQIKTLSFRASEYGDIFFDPFESKITTFGDSHDPNYCYYDSDPLEKVVHGMKSDRLFFESHYSTSSILENNNNNRAKVDGGVPFNFKESGLLLAIDSEDPYGDFRRSMEEVVETHGVKDWKGLEELLDWYLGLNSKNNHGFVVLAFVDLLINLASSDSCSHSSTSYCSAVSSFASSPLCPLDHNKIIDDQDEDNGRT